MRMRVVLAVGALAAIVPALAGAQQRPPAQQPRPATRPATPPAQRPAAQPAQRRAERSAAAHREGSFELTGSVGLFSVDRAFNGFLMQPPRIVNGDPSRFMFGGAGRLTYNVSENIGVSVGSGLGFGNGATLLAPFAALTYTFDLNKKAAPFLEAGFDMPRFSGNSHHVTAQYGAFGGLGFRSMIGENAALRVEGRMAYDKFKEWSDAAYNGTALAGVSFFMGGGPPKDTDADGVPDKRDKCPNTPHGAHVFPVGNARAGCPIDSDNDGVPDGLDQCANTPPNARPVYPIGNPRAGCPVDSDNDGVADYLDRCPNTPANARPLDANGCPVDSDGDGVADYLDRCPNTPTNARPVDAAGCALDSDNDRVPDYLDRCPNTPANARPLDANGCPVDSDHDGVADYLDRCPNTAPDTQVDANGCPVQQDSDHDGVIDANDRCPNTPAGKRVDASGCPLAEVPEVGRSIVMRDVYFLVGGSRLAPATMTYLDGVAAAIKATPNSRWEIGGFTSSPGSRAVNMRLSRQRAEAVMAYIVSKGVPASQMTAVGYGPVNFLGPNTTAAGRAQNRRVEMKRLQ